MNPLKRRLFIQTSTLAALAAVTTVLHAQSAASARKGIVIQVSDNDPAK